MKPDNIGVHVGSHSVHLFDWGEAVTLSDVHSAPDRELAHGVAVAGTPLFMAPEALNYLTRRGPQGSAGLRATLTTKLDIWGLGCVVFFMLSGRDVVSTDAGLELENLADLVDASDGIDLPDGCRASAAARDFLRCCLERDPELRSGAKQLLQHPWLAGATTLAELRAAKSAAARKLGGAALVTVMAHESEGDGEMGRSMSGGVQLTRVPRHSDGGASSSSGFSSMGFSSSSMAGEELRSNSFDEAPVCTVSLRGLAPFGVAVGNASPGAPAAPAAVRLV